MIVKNDQLSFISGLKEFEILVKQESPLWAYNLRKESLDRFAKRGLPTVKEEEWKYTNVASLKEHQFQIASDSSKMAQLKELKAYYRKEEINLVFINGVFSEELSNLKKLPKGLKVADVNDAALYSQKEAAFVLQRYPQDQDDSFIALNKAFLYRVAFVQIDPKTVIKPLIHIIHVTDAVKSSVSSFPRSLIMLGKSAEAQVMESHLSFSDDTYLTNALSDIVLDQDAKLVYCKAQGESKNAFHIGTTRVWQERDSQLDSFSLMTGGKITRNNLNIVLNGSGAHATLNGLYLINGNQHVDNHTAVDHRPPNCTSTQLYKGILYDAARAVFNGKIFVKKEAQQTNSYQLNKNLLLGPDCRVDTKPQLEIFADDVKCTHGATIGQLNEDEIFYLQTRCIPKSQAVEMLARGFVDDILNRIADESIVAKLNKLLAEYFQD